MEDDARPDGASAGTDEDASRKRAAVEAFDASAAAYRDSRVHREGEDLATLAEWAAGADRALDVATGAGHTAGAIADRGVPEVVAADGAPAMVRTAVETFDGVRGVAADAERLPFAADSFDAVACRIAAHHFPAPASFVREVARVTAPGGTFAFEDNVAPPDDGLDRFLNRIERLRDPTHVRSHRPSEWEAWLTDAGFAIEETVGITKEIEYASWVEQLDTPAPRRAEIESLLTDPPAGARELYGIDVEDGVPRSFSNLKLLVRATR